jgi:hypothetical protein
MIRQIWRLSEGGADNLGLACTNDGLILGRTPLIEQRDGRYVVRESSEIEWLLSHGYGRHLSVDRLMRGLATVASALNANDRGLAHIAAVHLRIPDLPDRAARDRMEAADVLIKYARDEAGGSNWNPALHPRAGTPPNPGWFAPTDGTGDESSSVRTAQNDDPNRRSDAAPNETNDWARLPPKNGRIDELADFLEWLANAKPEDAPAIKSEIKRYFEDVGWESAAKDLNRKLAIVLRPGITRDQRQQILKAIDIYSYADPTEYVRYFGIAAAGATVIGGVPPVVAETGAAGTAAGETATAVGAGTVAAAIKSPAEAWKIGWAARGRYFEEQLGRTLHPNFPVIDKIPDGIATSIKSIDLNAATYQNAAQLTYRLNKYVDEVAQFKGARWGGDEVKESQIIGRSLSLAIPKGSMSAAQREAIEIVRMRARMTNMYAPVDIYITEF